MPLSPSFIRRRLNDQPKNHTGLLPGSVAMHRQYRLFPHSIEGICLCFRSVNMPSRASIKVTLWPPTLPLVSPPPSYDYETQGQASAFGIRLQYTCQADVEKSISTESCATSEAQSNPISRMVGIFSPKRTLVLSNSAAQPVPLQIMYCSDDRAHSPSSPP